MESDANKFDDKKSFVIINYLSYFIETGLLRIFEREKKDITDKFLDAMYPHMESLKKISSDLKKELDSTSYYDDIDIDLLLIFCRKIDRIFFFL